MAAKRFNITRKAEKVLSYTFVATDKSPKKMRCDLVPKLREKAQLVLEDVIYANYLALTGAGATNDTRARRRAYQDDCLVSLRVLDSLATVANSQNYLTDKQYEYLTLLTQELYDMVLKWIESDAKRKV